MFVSRTFAARRAVLAVSAALAASALWGAASAHAQAWPTRMIKLVVPFPAGGPTDTASRIVGQRLAERLGQPVVVENRPGGNGFIAIDAFTLKAHGQVEADAVARILFQIDLAFDDIVFAFADEAAGEIGLLFGIGGKADGIAFDGFGITDPDNSLHEKLL